MFDGITFEKWVILIALFFVSIFLIRILFLNGKESDEYGEDQMTKEERELL